MTQRDRTRGSSGFSRDVTAPAAGGLRLPTRTLVRFLGLIGCRPAPRLVHEESRPFYGYHVVPSFFFFPQPPFRGWLLRERRVEYLRPFARFVTRPRRRSIRRSFSGDSRVRASNASNADERKEKGGEDDPTRERKLKPAIARRRGRTKTRSCE